MDKAELFDCLKRYGIPAHSLNRAVQWVNTLSHHAVTRMVDEFGLQVDKSHEEKAAKCVVHAILNGAEDSEKVVAFVYTRIPKLVKTVPTIVRTMEHLAPSFGNLGMMTVEAPLSTIIQEKMDNRGRRKTGNSAFCKAVELLDSAPTLSKAAQIDLLVANEIKKSSALVYHWKYCKGERE